MQGGTPTDRNPSPAARVGYHKENGLATKITCADCRDTGGHSRTPGRQRWQAGEMVSRPVVQGVRAGIRPGVHKGGAPRLPPGMKFDFPRNFPYSPAITRRLERLQVVSHMGF